MVSEFEWFALWNNFFTVVFYGLKTFLLQNSAILRNAARIRDG